MTAENQFVSCFEIKTFLVQITEKIDDKNLLKFLKTQLTLNDYSLGQNDFLGTVYLEESNKQFIFTNKESNKIQYFDLFYDELQKSDDKFVCIVCCDVIYIYKYKKIYYFQVLDFSFDEIEIKNLIFEKLNIKIDCFRWIDENRLNELKKNELYNTQVFNLNKHKNVNLFKILVGYILGLIFICSYLIYEKIQEKPVEIKKEYYTYKSKKLSQIIQILSSQKLIIHEMNFNKKLEVLVKVDKSFYNQDLLVLLKENFKIINSSFDKNENLYKVELHAK